MPKAIDWTRAMDDTLLSLRRADPPVPWNTVSRKLGVGRNVCIERVRHLGILPLCRHGGGGRPANSNAPGPTPVQRIDRPAMPAGNRASWDLLRAITPSLPESYPIPTFDRGRRDRAA